MIFSSVIGQNELKKKLLQSVKDNRISHAQLFLGSEGSGNLALAFAFAQYINCENKNENDSCGECPSCKKAEKLIHPDIHFSYPTVTAKNIEKPKSIDYISQWREAFLQNPYMNVTQWLQFIQEEQEEEKRNKQGNITMEECHDIIRKLNLKTFESKYKILIQWMPEYLGNSGNSLLKVIEEPPDNTVFIFVAENQDAILNTILSRMQITRIPLLLEKEIAFALQNKNQLSEEESRKTAFMSEGNYNQALTLLSEMENDNSKEFQSWVEVCLKNNGNELVKWVEKISKTGRENQKSFLRYGLNMLRESMLLDFVTNENAKLQQDEFEFLKKINERLDFEQKEKIIQLFDKNHYYIERNANPKILFMNLSVFISKFFQKKELTL